MVTARLYKQSGFNLLNIPDSEATLEASAAHIDVPAMDILQVMHNTHITIRAKESQVSDADFMKLIKVDDTAAHPTMTAFYAINSYTMTSGDVIDLEVSMEPILTAGGFSNFADYIEGTVTRHHLHKITPIIPPSPPSGLLNVKVYEYMVNSSVEDDPYLVPSYPAKLKFRQLVFQCQDIDTGQGIMDAHFPYALIVFSTLPTDVAANFKYDIGDPTSGDGLTAEISNYDGSFTTLELGIGSIFNDTVYTTQDSQSAYFNTPSSYVNYMDIITSTNELKTFKKRLSELAANNLTGIITKCYYVPMKWFSVTGNMQNATWSQVIAQFNEANFRSVQKHYAEVPVILDHAYPQTHGFSGNVKAKVIDAYEHGKCSMQPLMGKNFQLTMIASKTGDTKTFNPEELIQPDGTILFKGVPDPRPNGGVKFAVKRYGADDNEGTYLHRGAFTDIIEGGGWTPESIDSVGRTGYNVNRQLFNAQQQAKDTSTEIQLQSGVEPESSGNPFGAIEGFVRRYQDVYSAGGGFFNSVAAGLSGDAFTSAYSNGNPGDIGRGVRAGNERAITAANRQVEKASELAQFGAANSPQPVAVGSPATDDLDILSYSLILMQRVPDERDIDKFIKIQSRFGVRHTTLFDKDFIDNHMYFNYIEMTGANVYQIGTGSSSSILNSKMLRQAVADALNTGVRIWHVKPNTSDANPYKEGN